MVETIRVQQCLPNCPRHGQGLSLGCCRLYPVMHWWRCCRLYPVMHWWRVGSAYVSRLPLTPRADVTNESEHSLQLSLNLAPESFYSCPPSSHSQSTDNLFTSLSLARNLCHLCHMTATLLVREFKQSCLDFPVARRSPKSGVLPK